jgi:hypothetical protein
MRLVSHGEPHSWHVCVCQDTWSWSNIMISISGPVVREFANHARGLGFNPQDKRPLFTNNYFQFIKIECDLSRVRTSDLSNAKRARLPLYHELMEHSTMAGFICRIMSQRWHASRLSRRPHRWHVRVCRVTWSWSNNQISIGGPVVRAFANHARELGFNPQDKRPLISINYFQFIKIECHDLTRDRTSDLSHSKRAR